MIKLLILKAVGLKVIWEIIGGIGLFLIFIICIPLLWSDCWCSKSGDYLCGDCNGGIEKLKKSTKIKNHIQFILNFWSMTYKKWFAALKKDEKYLSKMKKKFDEEIKIKEIETKDKVAGLDRQIKDKEAEFERLSQREQLNSKGYELDKREAMLAIEAKNVGYIENLQQKIKDLEVRNEHAEAMILRVLNTYGGCCKYGCEKCCK